MTDPTNLTDRWQIIRADGTIEDVTDLVHVSQDDTGVHFESSVILKNGDTLRRTHTEPGER